MSYLLDTCLISEFVRKRPDPAVIHWLSEQSELDCYLSVLTIGELEKGIAKLPSSKKKEALSNWLRHDVQQRFHDRMLSITQKTAELWGKLQASAEKTGQALPVIDGLLAATAETHQLTLVTRNVKDFIATDVAIINPWAAKVLH